MVSKNEKSLPNRKRFLKTKNSSVRIIILQELAPRMKAGCRVSLGQSLHLSG
jgi:hypothetical protein